MESEHTPPAPDLADWSKLPVNMFVVSAKQIDNIGYEATLCNVPMALAPEVLYVRADSVKAQRDELLAAVDALYERLPDELARDMGWVESLLDRCGKPYRAEGGR